VKLPHLYLQRSHDHDHDKYAEEELLQRGSPLVFKSKKYMGNLNPPNFLSIRVKAPEYLSIMNDNECHYARKTEKPI
jgi:hypothetical protein